MTISLIITLIQALFSTGKTALEIYELIKDWRNHEVDGVTIDQEWLDLQWRKMREDVLDAEAKFNAS